jgi:hypothetical protein
MPEEIKKVLVIGLEGVEGGGVVEAAKTGRLPSLRRMIDDGVTLVSMGVDSSPESNWATLATGAHCITHGAAEDRPCRAEYLWQAAERTSKRGLLVNYPATEQPTYDQPHPEDLLSPKTMDLGYFEELSSYLLSCPDWDLALIRLRRPEGSLEDVDAAVGRLADAADLETLTVLVAIPDGGGDGVAVLTGPGIKRGVQLDRPSELADLAPTICYLAELPVPADCEGGILYQALEDPDAKILELQASRRNYERLRRSSGRGPMC